MIHYIIYAILAIMLLGAISSIFGMDINTPPPPKPTRKEKLKEWLVLAGVIAYIFLR